MLAAYHSARSGHSRPCPFLRQPSRANQFHMYWRPGSPRSRLSQWGTQQYNFSDGSVPQERTSSFSLSRLQCAQGKEVSAILQSSTKAVANWIHIHRAVMNFRSFSVVGNRSFCFSAEKQIISRWSSHRNSLEKKGCKMSKNENLSLEVFDSPEFGQMRILREGDKYLFCAKKNR